MSLPWTDVLDPEGTTPGAVAIPLDFLKVRDYELPSSGETVRVAGRLATEAAGVLRALGREAQFLEGDFTPGVRLWRCVAEEFPELAHNPGRALDIGCGSGRDAVWLAAHGWRVEAFDRLPDAIERGYALASRYTLSGSIAWQVRDWRQGLPNLEDFDLIVASRIALDLGKIGGTKPGARILEAPIPKLNQSGPKCSLRFLSSAGTERCSASG